MRSNQVGRLPSGLNGLAILGIAWLLASCGGGSGATASPEAAGQPAASTTGAGTSVGASGSLAAARLPSDCSGFSPALTDALKVALGGTAELDAGDSKANAVSLDCTWRNTATGFGSIRIQVPRNTDSAFIDLVASQEATGTKEYQVVSGFDEARQYGTKSFIAQNGGLAAWIQTNGVYPDATVDQFAAIAHAILG